MSIYKWIFCFLFLFSGTPSFALNGDDDLVTSDRYSGGIPNQEFFSPNLKMAVFQILAFYQAHPMPDSLARLLKGVFSVDVGRLGNVLAGAAPFTPVLTRQFIENPNPLTWFLDRVSGIVGGDSLLLVKDEALRSQFLLEIAKFKVSIEVAYTINRLLEAYQGDPLDFFIDNNGFEISYAYDLEEDDSLAQLPFMEVTDVLMLKMAELHRLQGDLPRAAEEIEQIRSIGSFDVIPLKITLLEVQEGKLKLAMGQYAEAIGHCKVAFDLAQRNGFKLNGVSACKCLYESYEALGDSSAAGPFRVQFDALKAEILKDKTVCRFPFFEFDFAGKQRQQVLLERKRQEQEIADERLKRANQLRNGLILTIFLTGLSLFLMFRISRNRKQANAVIQQSLREKEALIKEIHHRVKNNLQMVSGLLELQTQFLDSQDAREALTEGKSRLNSVALIHEQLYADDNRTHVEMDLYIGELVREVAYSFGLEEREIEIETVLEPLVLDVRQAIPVGLILHELVNNAVKYAFEGKVHGEVKVVLSRKGDASVELLVKDNGVGLSAADDAKRSGSYGHRMIRLFTETLNGTIAYRNDGGAVAVLCFPVRG